ncbi:hypothetical protein EIP91_007911 [Steccherinum ochraceum]|uniref:Uncharacterized protein n=1 Tax=Steccherinum ochraceum TaxID=92696 RepID=A0A4R0RSP4_9APHY|nr:hypothetical protein EIP91_007911 [Steccherinum ochraceum]
MQAETTATPHDEDDDGSLFGSPPPSPDRVRSSSPLALPSGQSSAKNVGTLALPGSHLFNELPSAPSSVTCGPMQNQPQSYIWHPPPAPPVPQPIPTRPPSVSSYARSRSATPAAVPRPTRPPRKSSKRVSHRSEASSAASTPRPTPPPIPLPDSSEPPPSNFLRNQQALLGLAGLVGGVNPANLALPRGSTANNPIVVDDEEDTPTIGRRPPQTYYPMGAIPVLYPTLVPAPSTDDIIQTLIKQKNIFPVVGALLSLVSRTAEGQSIWSQYHNSQSGFHRPYVNGPAHVPPAKKRRVHDVPAGAGDWDVPYPFPAGEGPTNYRANWERQRSKQLIGDLIALVKSAAKKAAAKNYYKVQQQQPLPSETETEPGKVFRHYRPETLRYGLEPGQALPVSSPVDAVDQLSGVSATAGPSILPAAPLASASHASPLPIPPTSTPSIDELFATMMSPPVPEPIQPAPFTNHYVFSASSPSTTSSIPIATPSASSSFASSSASASASTSQPPPNDFAPELQTNINDFLAMIDNLPPGDLSGLFNPTDDIFSSTASSMPTPVMSRSETGEDPLSQTFFPESQSPSLDFTDPFLASIDPVLLALSGPSSGDGFTPELNIKTDAAEKILSFGTAAPPTPTLVGSPLSMDHDEHGPPTPSWDFTFPDPEVVGGGNDSADGASAGAVGVGDSVENGGVVSSEGACLGRMDLRKHVLMKGLVRSADGLVEIGKDKGKGKEREVDVLFDFGFDMGAPFDRDIVMQDALYAPDAVNVPTSSSQSTHADDAPCHAPIASAQDPTSPAPAGPSAPQMGQPPTQSQPQPMASFPLSIALPIIQAASTSASTSTSSTPAPTAQSEYKKRKHETLKKARAMRAQLVAEIQRAKVELWETAMEGGCLVVLGKEAAKDAKEKERGRA